MTPPRIDPAAAGPAAGAPLAQRIAGELGRMRQALANLIEFSGMSRRQVERRLLENDCGTDLGRLLSGRLDLKMKHLLALCRVLELEPVEFVEIALKSRPGQRSPLLRRIEALLPEGRTVAAPPTPAPRAPDAPALLRRMQDLAERLDELMREMARLAAPEGGQRAAPSDGRTRCGAVGTDLSQRDRRPREIAAAAAGSRSRRRVVDGKSASELLAAAALPARCRLRCPCQLPPVRSRELEARPGRQAAGTCWHATGTPAGTHLELCRQSLAWLALTWRHCRRRRRRLSRQGRSPRRRATASQGQGCRESSVGAHSLPLGRDRPR